MVPQRIDRQVNGHLIHEWHIHPGLILRQDRFGFITLRDEDDGVGIEIGSDQLFALAAAFADAAQDNLKEQES